jgi:hypothetical protein
MATAWVNYRILITLLKNGFEVDGVPLLSLEWNAFLKKGQSGDKLRNPYMQNDVI